MRSSRKTDVIAKRTRFVRTNDGRYEPVQITFERPRKQPTGEWGCTYRVDGLTELNGETASSAVYGIDGVQALTLAMRRVDDVLLHSRAFAEGRLSWTDQGGPLRLTDFRGNPFSVRKGQGVEVAEIVRTVELQVEWSLPCTLRIEVLKSNYGPHTSYWTRVWRSDTYRLPPTGSVLRREPFRADETILVEDALFSDRPPFEKTPEAAIEETIARIKWQFFSRDEPVGRETKPRGRGRSRSR